MPSAAISQSGEHQTWAEAMPKRRHFGPYLVLAEKTPVHSFVYWAGLPPCFLVAGPQRFHSWQGSAYGCGPPASEAFLRSVCRAWSLFWCCGWLVVGTRISALALQSAGLGFCFLDFISKALLPRVTSLQFDPIPLFLPGSLIDFWFLPQHQWSLRYCW